MDRSDVYPGGLISMPGSSRRAQYQKWGSYSARACSSVSAT